MAFQGTCKSLLIGTKFQAKALHIVGHKKDFGSNIGTLVSDVQTNIKQQSPSFNIWEIISSKSIMIILVLYQVTHFLLDPLKSVQIQKDLIV